MFGASYAMLHCYIRVKAEWFLVIRQAYTLQMEYEDYCWGINRLNWPLALTTSEIHSRIPN